MFSSIFPGDKKQKKIEDKQHQTIFYHLENGGRRVKGSRMPFGQPMKDGREIREMEGGEVVGLFHEAVPQNWCEAQPTVGWRFLCCLKNERRTRVHLP